MLPTRACIAPALVLLLAGCPSNETALTGPPEIPSQDPGEDYGSWLSMDLAPDGDRLVISYYDRTKGALGFAIGTVDDSTDTISWHHEHVDGYAGDDGLDRGDRGQYSSMKVAPDGTVWIAYYDVNGGSLYAAHRTGGPTWETMLVDAGAGLTPDAGRWASLDIGANGQPVVAYQDVGKGALKVARYDEGVWTLDDVYAGAPVTDEAGTRPASAGQYARLLIDGSSEYVAFYDGAQQKLMFAEGAGGNWSVSALTDEGDMGAWPSILVDGDDLHIAFQDVGGQRLMLASRAGTAPFQVRVVDDAPYSGADTELFKRNGRLTALYFDGQFNDMKLATESGAAWPTEVVGESDRAVGFHNEAVKRGDTWWVASYDFTARSLFIRPLPTVTAP